jgi:hypothetical protein
MFAFKLKEDHGVVLFKQTVTIARCFDINDIATPCPKRQFQAAPSITKIYENVIINAIGLGYPSFPTLPRDRWNGP